MVLENMYRFLVVFILLFSSCVINPSARLSKHQINLQTDEYILFRSGGCIGPCDVHELLISKQGIKNYRLKKPHEPAIQFVGRFTSSENNDFWKTIDQLDWNAINEFYGIRAEDITPKTLLIFTKAHNKNIQYKHGEPMSIVQLEQEFMRIIDNTTWKIIQTK